jgi:hypothetical protein
MLNQIAIPSPSVNYAPPAAAPKLAHVAAGATTHTLANDVRQVVLRARSVSDTSGRTLAETLQEVLGDLNTDVREALAHALAALARADLVDTRERSRRADHWYVAAEHWGP